ncbi:MAG: hypothetical protein OEZ34_13230, partial [Spirochaetia bacterium]|nr:hypothetical protein [Spirochaetia bacterium]
DYLEYIPEKLRVIPYIRENIKHILVFFGVFQYDDDKNLVKNLCPPVTFARRINILNILFWKVTSLWYPNGRPIARARDDLISMLEFLVDHEVSYETLLYTLIATGYFREAEQNNGGIKLIIPSKPDSSAMIVKGATPSGLELHVVSKYDLIRSSDAPLVQFFCQKSDNEETMQYANWDALKMDTAERKEFRKDEEWEILGIAAHPDIFGFRMNRNSDSIPEGLDLLTMEIASLLDDDLVEKLLSFATFSSIVYLAFVRPGVNDEDKRIQKLKAHGIGILCLKSVGDLNSWYEHLSPVLKQQTADAKSKALNCFFTKDEMEKLISENINFG